MKKLIFMSLCVVATMLASCSREENTLQTNAEERTVTFTAALDGGMNLRATKTRGTDPTDGDITRAVLEIYKQGVSVGERIVGDIDGDLITFSAKLITGVSYNYWFWADGGEEAYDITYLTNIKLGANPSIAYYANETRTALEPEIEIVFNHAVAKVVLYETGTLNVDDKVGISIAMPNYSFNIDQHEAGLYDPEPDMVEVTGSFNITSATTAGEVGSLYVFAPNDGEVARITLSYTGNDGIEKIKKVSNVPLRSNYRTVLKGKFAEISGVGTTQEFNVTLNRGWGDISTTAAVGDYYYEGGFFSEDYYYSLTCLGIVFEVDDATGEHGKVISIDEAPLGTQWGISGVVIGTNETAGPANMAAAKANGDELFDYPAFKWCADKGEGWYLPAINELLEFREFFILDSDAFNEKLRIAGEDAIQDDDEYFYWASTECDAYPATNARCVAFGESYVEYRLPKDSSRARARAMMKF